MPSRFQRVDKKEIVLNKAKDIIIAGDVGCTGFDDETRTVFDAILRQRCDLFFIAGDLVCHGTAEEFSEFIDFCDKRSRVPVFALCGNHDLPDYAKHCGASSYSVITSGPVCVSLDNSSARFSKEDLEFLEAQFKKYNDRKFIVLFHVPPPVDFKASHMSDGEWMKLRGVLDRFRERVECIVCAHIHGLYEYRLDGYRVFITAGGGGKMIYDMPDPAARIYHAVRISLRKGGPADISVIPV